MKHTNFFLLTLLLGLLTLGSTSAWGSECAFTQGEYIYLDDSQIDWDNDPSTIISALFYQKSNDAQCYNKGNSTDYVYLAGSANIGGGYTSATKVTSNIWRVQVPAANLGGIRFVRVSWTDNNWIWGESVIMKADWAGTNNCIKLISGSDGSLCGAIWTTYSGGRSSDCIIDDIPNYVPAGMSNELWIAGKGLNVNWDPNDFVAMNKAADGIFWKKAKFRKSWDDCTFKFMWKKAWGWQWGATSSSVDIDIATVNYNGYELNFMNGDSKDWKFHTITTSGDRNVVCDFVSEATQKMYIYPADQIYLDLGGTRYAMEWNESTGNYSCSTEIPASTTFRFCVKDDGSGTFGAAAANTEIGAAANDNAKIVRNGTNYYTTPNNKKITGLTLHLATRQLTITSVADDTPAEPEPEPERVISDDYHMRGDLWVIDDNGNWAGTSNRGMLPKPYQEIDGTTYTFSYIAPVANKNRFAIQDKSGSAGEGYTASLASGSSSGITTPNNAEKYAFDVTGSPKQVTVTFYSSNSPKNAKVVLSDYTPNTEGWYFKCESAIGGVAANTNTAMASDGTLTLTNVAAGTYNFYIHDNASELYWGVNKFGGCYVDQTNSTASLISSLTTDAKFNSKQWPIKSVSDRQVKMVVEEGDAGKNIRVSFDGGKITINTVAAPTPAVTYTVTIHPDPNNVNNTTTRNSVPEGSTSSASELNLSAFTYGAGTATWYTNEACTTPFTTVTGNMHLYAKWGVSGEYYLVGDLQTASDAGSSGNWSNGLGRKLEYPGNETSGVCSFSFVAPKGKTVFEIIKNKDWGQKLNGGSYSAVLDNTNSDVTLSEEGGHISFTLATPKLVTVSLDGKVKVTTANVAFDNSKEWRVKTSSGWGADRNNWDWNTIMTNHGTTNATAILEDVTTGSHQFIISTETSDNEAYKYVGNKTFHALYVDTSTPSAGLTWNTNTVRLAGNVNTSNIPHATDDNYERRCKFTLANDANAINGTYDLLITFDGGSIRCDVQPKHTVTFYDEDGTTVLSTVQVFDGRKVTAAVHNKSGYDFVKWHENGVNTQFDFANTAITGGNLSLYGEWEHKHISSVSLNESTHYTWVGNSNFTLTLTKDPEDLIAQSVVWSSNNESVATVSNGTVHIEESAGITEETVVRITCTVTDQHGTSRSAYCDVTVAPCEMTTDNLYSMTVTGYNSSTGNAATLTGLWNSSEPENITVYHLTIIPGKDGTKRYLYADASDNYVKRNTSSSDAEADNYYWIQTNVGTTGSSLQIFTLRNYGMLKNGQTETYLASASSNPITTNWGAHRAIVQEDGSADVAKWHFIDGCGAKMMNMATSNGDNSYSTHETFLHVDTELGYGDIGMNMSDESVVAVGSSDNCQNRQAHRPALEGAKSVPNPNHIASLMNGSYYRMNTNATVQANLAAALVKGAIITVRLYADAATSVKLEKTDGTEIATIDLNANAARDYTYTVNTLSALLGESAFVIKAADNHAAISSISVSRLHAVSPSIPDFTWDDPALSSIAQSTLAGNIVHTASSTESLGAIFYTSSNPSVATVAADGTVTPIMAGNTTITATIEQRECYAEAYITYEVTLTEPSLAEMIANDAGAGITLTHDYNENIVIDKAITINGGDHAIGNLTVQMAGDLTLSGALTVNDFSIYAKAGNTTTPAASGQVRNANNLTVNGEAYFLYTVDPSGHVQYGWYDFTVPFRVNVMTGIAGIENEVLNEDFVNERNYAIMEHLGEKQAAGEYAYKKFRGIMEPCRLYSITLDDDYNYNTIRFQKTNDGALVAGNEVTLNAYAGETKHANWNGVGNGTLHHADAGVSAEYIQVYQSGNKTFLPVDRAQYSLVIGSAFMVQQAGTMTLNQATHDKLLAPKREASVQPTAIQIASEGQPFSDQLFISADETAGQGYTQGADVAKAGNIGNVNVPQIWTNAYNSKLCAHEAQLVNGEASYTLSLYAPANGSYTLTSKNIPEGYTLYLTQNGNRIWDLSESYGLDLTKGTATEYGLLLVENYKMPTAIENIGSQADETQKIMRNGILYILRNGKVFNAQGAVMK